MSSRIALGTAQFGMTYGIANSLGRVTQSAVVEIIKAARCGGIDTLDTAISYGGSESSLGLAGVGGFRVVTKLPAVPETCEDVTSWVEDGLKSSLCRLRIDQLYGVMMHSSKSLTGPRGPELIEALRFAKEKFKIKRIGVSIYSPRELEDIYQIFLPEIVQAPINLVDQRMAKSGWLKQLSEDGVEVHSRSTFLQGLLLMPLLPAKFFRWEHLWKKWKGWQILHPDLTVAACLAYPLSFPEIKRVVVGVDTLAQFKQLQREELLATSLSDLPDLGCIDEELINPSNW